MGYRNKIESVQFRLHLLAARAHYAIVVVGSSATCAADDVAARDNDNCKRSTCKYRYTDGLRYIRRKIKQEKARVYHGFEVVLGESWTVENTFAFVQCRVAAPSAVRVQRAVVRAWEEFAHEAWLICEFRNLLHCCRARLSCCAMQRR